MPTATWIHADSRQALTNKDQGMVTRLNEVLTAADRLALELPSVLHLMRDHQNGQPRAASYSPSSSTGTTRTPEPWELEEPATGHPDPTGDAATRPDRAIADQRLLHTHLEAAISHLTAAIAVANTYPRQPGEPEDVEPTPGEDWCRSCWKDRKYCEPISRRSDGTPWYSGMCRWCGDALKTIGHEPPTWMLEKRHRGERITASMIDRAKTEARKKKKQRKTT